MDEQFFVGSYAGIVCVSGTTNWNLINQVLDDYPEVNSLNFNFTSDSFFYPIQENLSSLKKLLDDRKIHQLNIDSMASLTIFVAVDFQNVFANIKKVSIHLDYDFYIVQKLFQSLKSMTLLTNLSLMNFNDYWHFLIPYIQETTSIKKLHISSQITIAQPKLSLFFETIKTSSITKLSLKGFQLSSDNIKILQSLIDNRLQSFSMAMGFLENLTDFISFENCKFLQKLNWRLSGNSSKCLSTLKNNSSITKLILSCFVSSNVFNNYHSLQQLQIHIGSNVINYNQFCVDLGLLKNLRKLSISGFLYCHFNLLISSCKQLSYLSLCGSGPESSLDISPSLSINQNLKTVYLNCNIVFKNITKIIENNKTLRDFSIARFNDSISDVAKSFQMNSTITRFEPIPDLYRKNIVRVLKQNQRLYDFKKQKLWKLCLAKIQDKSLIPQIILDQTIDE